MKKNNGFAFLKSRKLLKRKEWNDCSSQGATNSQKGKIRKALGAWKDSDRWKAPKRKDVTIAPVRGQQNCKKKDKKAWGAWKRPAGKKKV